MRLQVWGCTVRTAEFMREVRRRRVRLILFLACGSRSIVAGDAARAWVCSGGSCIELTWRAGPSSHSAFLGLEKAICVCHRGEGNLAWRIGGERHHGISIGHSTR